jgi:hypothetical protein
MAAGLHPLSLQWFAPRAEYQAPREYPVYKYNTQPCHSPQQSQMLNIITEILDMKSTFIWLIAQGVLLLEILTFLKRWQEGTRLIDTI